MINTEKSSKNFKKLREDLMINQAEFGRMLGLTRQSICAYEKGYRAPGIKVARLIVSLMRDSGINIDFNFLRPMQ